MLPNPTTKAGRLALEAAISVVRSVTEPDPVRRAAQVRTLLEPELASFALTQVVLRDRAVDKFGAAAARMWFTTDGLEQSSRTEVADHRATRFAQAGLSRVLDLCCGIGADAVAFRRAGLSVVGVDRDPATARIAAANLLTVADTETTAEVVIAEAEATSWRSAESIFIDPARRTARGRTFDPAAFSPPLMFVLDLLAEVPFAAAKLSPGLDHALIPAGVEAEWVSFAGGVKEAVLWSAGFGDAADPGGEPVTRRAAVLPADAQLTDRDPSTDTVAGLGTYLYEPDGAVIRAGLVQQAAALVNGWRIDPRLAYLSSDSASMSPLVKGYRIDAVMPYSVKRLRAELRRREIGIVEIKKRGVDVDPARLRVELKPSGPNSLTVILARAGAHRLAVLAQPLSPRA